MNNRMTIQKRIIMEELGKTKEHPAAETLYGRVKERLPEISIGTVYRNLEILIRSGKARKLIDSKRINRFDGNPERHFHIECTNCGRIDDFPLKTAELLKKDIYTDTDYEITAYDVFFYGICPGCKQR